MPSTKQIIPSFDLFLRQTDKTKPIVESTSFLKSYFMFKLKGLLTVV